MERIKELYDLANAYCRYVSENRITVDSVSPLMELLMKLYISAIDLPELEPEEGDHPRLGETDHPSIRLCEQMPQFYWEVFDPFVREEPVCGDIADDLSDIAADLQIGMREYEAGRIGNAVFEWKLGLNSHWGSHIVDALRVLHALKAR